MEVSDMVDAGLIVGTVFILSVFSKIIYDSFWGWLCTHSFVSSSSASSCLLRSILSTGS